MTEKELLYVEDALSHEQFFQEKCKECEQMATDPQIKNFIQQVDEKHKQLYTQFYSLLK